MSIASNSPGTADATKRWRENIPRGSSELINHIDDHLDETDRQLGGIRTRLDDHLFVIEGTRYREKLFIEVQLDGDEVIDLSMTMRFDNQYDYGYPVTKSDINTVRIWAMKANSDGCLHVTDFNSLQGFTIDAESFMGHLQRAQTAKRSDLANL